MSRKPANSVGCHGFGCRDTTWLFVHSQLMAAGLYAPAPNPKDEDKTECPTNAMDEARSSEMRTAPPGRMGCMAYPNDVSRGEPGIKI